MESLSLPYCSGIVVEVHLFRRTVKSRISRTLAHKWRVCMILGKTVVCGVRWNFDFTFL